MRSAFRAMILGMLAMGLAVSNAGAAGDLAAQQLVDDPQFDHLLWADVEASATPAAFDLKAAYIAETTDTVDFIWEYWDIPDGSGGLFEGNTTYWEFSLDDNDGIADPVLYSLRARPEYPAGLGVHVHCNNPGAPISPCRGVGPGGGDLQGNCTQTSSVISCTTVRGSLVTLAVDDIANTITAKVRRIDLRDADGKFLAEDGTVLHAVDIFAGIAACQGIVLNTDANCDVAEMSLNLDEDTGGYVFGQAR